ncbi:MAG: hypothetical protein AB1649_22460 [Chloroflexota bacterium]
MTEDKRRLTLDPKLIPLPLQDLIRFIADKSEGMGTPCYLVGGLVRDLMLGRAVNDFDVVVEGNAIKLGKALVRELGGKLTTHSAFATATWYLPAPTDGLSLLDLISARSETYAYPGALPSVKLSTIENDLRRRDFTINAMALRLDREHAGEVLDPLDGRNDLKRGLVRVLHDRSFIDDPTRMLRAVRYEKRYDFQIESKTLSLFNADAHAVMSQLSGERLRHEFDLMFREDNFISMLARSAELGLLKAIHPSLSWSEEIEERFSRLQEAFVSENILWGTWLMDLPEADIRSLGKRLHFTADVLKVALAASAIAREITSISDMKPSQCVEQLDKMPDEAVSAVAMSTAYGKPRVMLESYMSRWKDMKPTITGDDLKARGIPPGPKYKEVLARLRAAWVDGEVKSVAEEAKLLEDLLR